MNDKNRKGFRNRRKSGWCSSTGWNTLAFEIYRALQKAVELKPNYIDARYNLGSILFKAQPYVEAVAAYQTIIELIPKDAEARGYLGVGYSNLGDLDKAIESFQKTLKRSRGSKGYGQNLAGAETKLKEQYQINHKCQCIQFQWAP